MARSQRHILLLEDNRDVLHAFSALFAAVYRYALDAVTSVRDAKGLIGRQAVDVAVCDLASGPEVSARLEMIRTWRADGEIFPIIATSAHDYDGLSIESLASGADDFVRKPFRFSEMAARIERHIGRAASSPTPRPRLDGVRLPPSAFTFAGAVIYPDLRAQFPDGRAVQLSAKQVGILQEFARQSGALVFRNELIHAVWGADANTNSKSLDQYLYVLRRTYRESGIELGDYITPALRVGWRVAAHASTGSGDVNTR